MIHLAITARRQFLQRNKLQPAIRFYKSIYPIRINIEKGYATFALNKRNKEGFLPRILIIIQLNNRFNIYNVEKIDK